MNLDLSDFEHAYERESNEMRMNAKATECASASRPVEEFSNSLDFRVSVCEKLCA